jgi:hypothetical protein
MVVPHLTLGPSGVPTDLPVLPVLLVPRVLLALPVLQVLQVLQVPSGLRA